MVSCDHQEQGQQSVVFTNQQTETVDLTCVVFCFFNWEPREGQGAEISLVGRAKRESAQVITDLSPPPSYTSTLVILGLCCRSQRLHLSLLNFPHLFLSNLLHPELIGPKSEEKCDEDQSDQS
jgi:hypothetical protein